MQYLALITNLGSLGIETQQHISLESMDNDPWYLRTLCIEVIV